MRKQKPIGYAVLYRRTGRPWRAFAMLQPNLRRVNAKLRNERDCDRSVGVQREYASVPIYAPEAVK